MSDSCGDVGSAACKITQTETSRSRLSVRMAGRDADSTALSEYPGALQTARRAETPMGASAPSIGVGSSVHACQGV
jgi:hypothetical protein